VRLVAALAGLVALVVAGAVAWARPSGLDPPPPAPAPAPLATPVPGPPAAAPTVGRRRSRALGLPYAGRLRGGVQLPAEGPDFATWDAVLERAPNRAWRRWGTDELVATVLAVVRDYRAKHPDAPRVLIGDLSRPHGGDFGRRFGGLGHASHQNGLDVDVFYPRVDGRERRPYKPALVDPVLAQDLVDRFVDAGAQRIFVGPRLRLRGPRRVVSRLVHHDDHLHVRLPNRRRR
jgi:murein endopeptidase